MVVTLVVRVLAQAVGLRGEAIVTEEPGAALLVPEQVERAVTEGGVEADLDVRRRLERRIADDHDASWRRSIRRRSCAVAEHFVAEDVDVVAGQDDEPVSR